MNAMEFWEKYGTDVVKKVCDHAETSFEYFKHIAHGRKRPSVDLAERLVAGSAIHAGEPMNFLALCIPKKKGPHPANKKFGKKHGTAKEEVMA